MKRVIREGVFETNSSSTHSVVFKRKNGSVPDEDSSYELHSPLSMTLFLIGLCTNAERCSSECEYDEYSKDSYYDSDKTLSNKFKDAVILEYIKSEGITSEEFDRRFAESIFTCDGECLCRNFFDDDVLDMCTCPFDSYYGIAASFELRGLYTEDDFRARATEYLSGKSKFVLKEFCGGIVPLVKKEIY